MTDTAETVTETAPDLEQINLELGWRVAELEEQWDQAAAALLRVRAEDEGWNLWGTVKATSEDGFSLEMMKKVGKEAELQSTGNPLLRRGFQLRYQGVFSKPFRLEGKMPPRVKRMLQSPSMDRVLMKSEGIEQNERTLYNRGNLFVIVNPITQEVRRVPLEQIANRATDPDDTEVTAYYLRHYDRKNFDGTTERIEEWYPTIEWKDAGVPIEARIANTPVNPEWVIVDLRVNVPSGGHWGVPDCFAALPYAWAYSEYIRDASSLLKALTMIAWKVVGKTQTQAQAAGVRLSKASSSGPGGVAVMTPETQMSSMPRAGQVDMNDGLALAAQVASALDVPVTALLNNPAIGGGFGSVAALDGPTVAMARARQERWSDFYVRVFRAMGFRDLTLDFPRVTEDPVHRQVSSLATGRATGAIYADEYAQAQNALGFMQMTTKLTGQLDSESDPLSRQGNSGVSGRLGEIDNTNRNLDTQPGTGTQTNLVG
jgi:hypothetical protein